MGRRDAPGELLPDRPVEKDGHRCLGAVLGEEEVYEALVQGFKLNSLFIQPSQEGGQSQPVNASPNLDAETIPCPLATFDTLTLCRAFPMI